MFRALLKRSSGLRNHRLCQPHHRWAVGIGGRQGGPDYPAFHEERLDYAALFQRIQQAIKEIEDSKTRVYAVGEPILYGWIIII